MTDEFKSDGPPISVAGFGAVAGKLGVFAPEIWAILTVETRGAGYTRDRKPLILFERHVFSRLTKRKYDEKEPEISNRKPGGWGPQGAHQYKRLARAIRLDRTAALMSASWGIGQVMGENFKMAGYPTVEAMVSAMVGHEDAQLDAMASFIASAGLAPALRSHDWPSFARGYNGPAFARNQYDSRLASAHERFSRGPLPDLAIRRAQALLGYLGYDPGPVDGVVGRFTRDAILQFQLASGLKPTGDLDDKTAKHLDDTPLP